MGALELTKTFSSPGFGPMNLGADNLRLQDLLELVRFRKVQELCQAFPRWTQVMDNMQLLYDELCRKLEDIGRELQTIQDPQAFTKATAEYEPWTYLLRTVRRRPAISTIAQAFALCTSKQTIQALERHIL